MKPVKAITNRHPKFLKEAYKLDGIVDLINDERYLSYGDRFIRFDGGAFAVLIKTDTPVQINKFDNLMSAVNCARRI